MHPQTIILYFAAIVSLVAVSVAGHKGITIPGKYELETALTDEKYGKFLEAEGIPEEARKKIQSIKKVEVIIQDPKFHHWELDRITDGKRVKLAFESGTQFETELADGTVVNNTITVDKEEHTAHRVVQLPGGESTQDVRFSKKGGFLIKMKCNGVEVELKFKRVGNVP